MNFHKINFFLLAALSLLVTSNVIHGVEVCPRDEASIVCTNWLREYVARTGEWTQNKSPKIVKEYNLFYEDTLLAYVFEIYPQGYVIIAGYKELTPIAGFSPDIYNDNPAIENISPILKESLLYYVREIMQDNDANNNSLNIMRRKTYEKDWLKYSCDSASFRIEGVKENDAKDVYPFFVILHLRWDQESPFNDFCPAGDISCTQCQSMYNLVTPSHAGCVAVSAAMIMRYYQFPSFGNSSITYHYYGDITCDPPDPNPTQIDITENFNILFDWDIMPWNYDNPPYNPEENYMLSQACYKVGAAFWTQYGVCYSTSQIVYGQNVFDTYFGYNNLTMDDYWMFDVYPGNHKITDRNVWFNYIQVELAAGRPILYGALSSGCKA